MKRIKVITIHDLGNNFGSTLQACSLCDFLDEHGYDVELIDYKPTYAYHHGKLAQVIKAMMFPKSVFLQHRRFEKYFIEHVKRTKRRTSYVELLQENHADCFIVGSDQVWNEFYNAGKDGAYYLEFTDSPNKIAFSTSLGQLHTPEELERLRDRTRNFLAISVREMASCRQLHEIGMNSVEHVLDPVFLHDRDYYSHGKNKYGDYLLVYSVNNDTLMDAAAQKIAAHYGLKIVLVGGYIQKIKHDYYLRDAGPEEFCNLIEHAKFVLANSFHATAMSILFNKQFAVVLSKNSPMRLIDMLETAKIYGRIIRNESDVEKMYDQISYSEVNKEIDHMRIKSKEFLLNSLSQI